MIEARGLTKRYGSTLAVDGLSFDVKPGRVTGFLGPNGAGKSTTLRLIMGLDAPTAGSVTVDGLPYGAYHRPLFDVGAMLEARSYHPGRSAYNHLLALAQSNGIPRRRVQEVLEVVGLAGVARKRTGTFSLGMGQRLGVAAALLGDPAVLLLDEPVNGLDPEGIIWIRNLLKSLAAEGRTVLLSSHLMSEMANTADQVIVIGRGRLIAESTVEELVRTAPGSFVRVRARPANRLARLLRAEGASTTVEDDGALTVTGADAEAIGELAASHRIALHELSPQHASLEEAFMELTADSVEYRSDASHTPAQKEKVASR
ncbi:MAG: type transport system ATP-binding protein [Actinomycetota bacterium]|jgi:ABC-2 type transport system ATP-binding protein|nr:type transport system ATP-binding protein [Actinomycetota bacterium]